MLAPSVICRTWSSRSQLKSSFLSEIECSDQKNSPALVNLGLFHWQLKTNWLYKTSQTYQVVICWQLFVCDGVNQGPCPQEHLFRLLHRQIFPSGELLRMHPEVEQRIRETLHKISPCRLELLQPQPHPQAQTHEPELKNQNQSVVTVFTV